MMDKNEIGRIGEEHVAQRLREQGVEVQMMPTNHPDHDLEVCLPDGRKLRIQVKTSAQPSSKQPYWRMRRSHRNCAAPDLFFVFQRLDSEGGISEAFVVPSVVVELFINEANDHYYSVVSSKRDTGVYKFLKWYNHLPQYQKGWLSPYENNWELIVSPTAA